MSVLSQLPAGASAEQVAAVCLDGLEQLLAELGLLAGEGPALVEAARGAVTELVGDAERLAELLEEANTRPLCGACGGPITEGPG